MPARGQPSVLHIDGGRQWGGGQNQVRLLMRALARLGTRQLCLCPLHSPLAAWLRREGLPVEAIRWRRGNDPAALWAIARRVGAWDVVHCHDAHALQLAVLPCRLRGRPVIATRRSCFRTRALKWNLATSVVAISTPVQRTLLESGVHASRIRTIPSGVDLEELRGLEPAVPSLRQLLGLADDAFLVGNVGSLHEVKNQVLIARAAAAVATAQWVIIGEGPERARIESEIVAAGVGERVRLTGELPDARRCLRELDVFVFPSVDEALGTSLLDAMAAGVPVLAAASGGPADLLGPIHAELGIGLFPPDDPAALADMVEKLRTDRDLRGRVVQRQGERLDDYRIERVAHDLLALYRASRLP